MFDTRKRSDVLQEKFSALLRVEARLKTTGKSIDEILKESTFTPAQQQGLKLLYDCMMDGVMQAINIKKELLQCMMKTETTHGC